MSAKDNIMDTNELIIAVDFDGTCVTHNYPKVGRNIGAEIVLKALHEKGVRLIVHTMRSNDKLRDAEDWFRDNGIALFGVNENSEQKAWTQSPKPYAHLYIDDAALGVPLMYRTDMSNRPFVDWWQTTNLLAQKGLFGEDERISVLKNLSKGYPKIF